MNPKPIIIATCCAIAIVVTVYFGGQYILEQGRPNYSPVVSLKDTPTTLEVTVRPNDSTESQLTSGVSGRSVPTEQANATSGEEMSEEKIKAYWASLGLEPPSDGYYYTWEDGTAQLAKFNHPEVKVHYGESRYGKYYQLSESEYQQYIVLKNIADNPEAIERGVAAGIPRGTFLAYPPEVVELARNQVKPLYEKTYGPDISFTTNVMYNREQTADDDKNIDKLIAEMQADLMPDRDPNIDENARGRVLTELFEAVGLNYHQFIENWSNPPQ